MHRLVPLATYSYTLLLIVASLAKLAITFVPKGVSNSDKYAHGIAYFGFTIVWSLFFYVKSKEGHSKKVFLKGVGKTIILGVFFGIIMEVAQLVLTNYRQFDLKDALANSVGVLFGAVLLYSFANIFMLIKKRTI